MLRAHTPNRGELLRVESEEPDHESAMDNTSSVKGLYCAKTRKPIKPGTEVREIVVRLGVVNQAGVFSPLTQSERHFISIDEGENNPDLPRLKPTPRRIP